MGKNKDIVEAADSSIDPWQTREDVADLMRPHMLRMNKARYKRALGAMRKTLQSEEGRGKALKHRAGRKTMARNIGRR